MPNAANRIFGSIDGNFDRSAGPVNTTREGIYSQHAIYMPYTYKELLGTKNLRVKTYK